MAENSIAVLQTGGTIDKDYPRSILGYAFEISDPAVPKILDRGRAEFRVETLSVCRKDSQEITNADRKLIADACVSAAEEKIIITHGTDTMIETANFLADCSLSRTKIIMITGAFKPETFKDSDADFNIGVAVGALQMLATPGVYVSMNGGVWKAGHVTRDKMTGKFVTADAIQ